MNLPMALTASMMKDGMDMDALAESRNAIQEMELNMAEEEDADI